MCCGNIQPIVKLSYKSVFLASPVWNDKRCPGRAGARRELQWRFYINGHTAHITGFGLPTDTLPIGTGSTFLILNASAEGITAFLILQGVVVATGNLLEIEVRIRNCESEYATSNRIRIIAQEPATDCDCEFLTNFQSSIAGNSATLPGDFSGEFFAWRNGLLNYAGNDFSDNPITVGDEVMFATLTGCTATIDTVIVTNQTGTVAIPGPFAALAAANYLLFRNGVNQRGFTQSSGAVTPDGDASDPGDIWLFARVADSDTGCKFGSILVGASVSGNSVNLQSGYTSTNQSDWILVRNGLAQYPGSASDYGYTVSAGVITPVVPFDNDLVWLIVIL